MKFQKQVKYFLHILLIVFLAFLIRSFGYGLYRVPTGSMEVTMLVGELFFADKFSVLFKSPNYGDIITFNDPLFAYSENIGIAYFQKYLWGPSNWTKRVIGVPGDEIKGVVENGIPVIYRNGIKLEECYVNKYPLLAVWKELPDIKKQMDSGILQSDELWAFKAYDPKKKYDEQPWYCVNSEYIVRDYNGEPIVCSGEAEWLAASIDYNSEINHTFWNGSDIFFIKLGENQYWVMGDNRLNSYDSRSFGPLSGSLIHGKICYRLLSFDSSASSLLVELLSKPRTFWKSIRWDRCLQCVT